MTYTQAEIYLAATNMKTFGGAFAAYIGSALMVADSHTLKRLAEAFPELIVKYLDPVWKA